MTHKNLDLIVSIQSLGLVQQVSGNKMHNQKVQYFGFNSSLPGNAYSIYNFVCAEQFPGILLQLHGNMIS